MYKAIEIAHKILKKATVDDNGEFVTNMKLQKLLYYMQGFHLAWFDTPLFDEEIEAWMYGPVVPSVFETYKHEGKRGIEYSGNTIMLLDEEESLFNHTFWSVSVSGLSALKNDIRIFAYRFDNQK